MLFYERRNTKKSECVHKEVIDGEHDVRSGIVNKEIVVYGTDEKTHERGRGHFVPRGHVEMQVEYKVVFEVLSKFLEIERSRTVRGQHKGRDGDAIVEGQSVAELCACPSGRCKALEERCERAENGVPHESLESSESLEDVRCGVGDPEVREHGPDLIHVIFFFFLKITKKGCLHST